MRSPEQVSGELHGHELSLYRLIWQRTLASQMADAVGTTVSVRLGATATDGADCRVRGQRHDHHLPRLPPGLRRVVRRPGGAATPSGRPCCPPLTVGAVRARRVADPQRPHHLAAGPLHRGQPGQAAGGAGHRPAVDVGQHHPDHPRPGLRVEEGPGPGADVDGVRRRAACWSSTSTTSSTTPSPPASRTTSTPSPAATRTSCAG